MKTKYNLIREHFKENDPIIFKAMKGLDFGEWFTDKNSKTSHDYFISLCRSIVGQQLAGSAAKAIYKRFENLFEDGKITPIKLNETTDQALRDIGMSWAKASYVKNIAEAYINKTIDFENLSKLSNEEVKINLIKIKGVGEWTAEMFLMFTLEREDVFSFGDLGLKNGFAKLYNKKNPTKKQIEKVIKKWSPYKTYGAVTLWHSLDQKE